MLHRLRATLDRLVAQDKAGHSGHGIAAPKVATAASGGTFGSAIAGGVTSVPVGAMLRAASRGTNRLETGATDFAGGGAVIAKLARYVSQPASVISDKLIGRGFLEGVEKAVADIATDKLASDLIVAESVRTGVFGTLPK
jgi:hypothetical protein